MGEGSGSRCQSVVGSVEGVKDLPCKNGCVRELLARGLDRPKFSTISIRGRNYRLTCVPLGRVVLSIISSGSAASPANWQMLTPRECEVLGLLSEGETVPSMASRLDISESTVRTHIEHMRDKLGVNTQGALVSVGYRLGFLG